MEKLAALQQNTFFAHADLTGRLRILMEEFASQLRSSGYPIWAYQGKFEDSKLLQLPPAKIEGIYNSFSVFYDVCAASLDSPDKEDRTMAWNMCLRLRLKPLSDVFGHIKRGDIIEIYNEDSIQVFRSFSFFHLVSYTLADLFSHEWWELYDRPESANREMMVLGAKILHSQHRATVLAGVEPHVVREVFSEDRKRAAITEVLLSPLLNSENRVGGFIHVFRANIQKVVAEAQC